MKVKSRSFIHVRGESRNQSYKTFITRSFYVLRVNDV